MWDFHQALAPSWAFFAHCFGQRTFPRASACGIFTDGVWYSGTSEKLALTTSGGNDALSPALWKSPRRCVSVRRWVCAVLGQARHSLAPAPRAAQSAYALLRLHIDCACALSGTVHFLGCRARTEHFCMTTGVMPISACLLNGLRGCIVSRTVSRRSRRRSREIRAVDRGAQSNNGRPHRRR